MDLLLVNYWDKSGDEGRAGAEQAQEQEQDEEASSGRSIDVEPPCSSYSPVPLMAPPKSCPPGVTNSSASSNPNGRLPTVWKLPVDLAQHRVNLNLSYDQLWAPIAGPAHPFAKDGMAQGMWNHKLGYAGDAAIAPFMFDEQYNTFQSSGYAADPAGFVGLNLVATVNSVRQQGQRKRKAEAQAGEEGEAAEEEDRFNPATEEWLLKNGKSPWSGKKQGLQGGLTEEQKKYADKHQLKKTSQKERGEKVEIEEKSTFHGKEERDYQGRSCIVAPKDVKASIWECKIPKRWIHTWSHR